MTTKQELSKLYPQAVEHLDCVPEHMHVTICDWLVEGKLQSEFLAALLSNDLKATFRCADNINREVIHYWVYFLYNYAPGLSWGSPEVVKHWKATGGLRGLLTSQKGTEQ